MASTAVVFDILAKDRASDKFDHLGKSVDGSSSKMAAFTGVMKTAGKAAAVGLGAGLVLAAGAAVKFAQAAAEDQQSAELMATAFRNNADATDQQIGATERWITAQGKALGVTDDELRPALSRLITSTKDVGDAQKLASLAMDVSAGSGKSLESVSTALMKANNGQVSALSRLGINTKNAAGETISMREATARMADTFGGAASTKAGTLQGKMDRLKVIFDETKESIGSKLIPIVSDLADWFLLHAVPAAHEMWQKLKRLVDIAWPVISDGLDAIADAGRRAKEKIGDLVGWFQTLQDMDAGQIGVQIGSAIAAGFDALIVLAGPLAESLSKMFAKVDWVGLGITIGKYVPALLLGLATGILNFDLASVLTGIKDHWGEILLAVLAIAFAPSKIAGGLGKILAKIPFVGKFLEHAVLWLNEAGSKLTSFGGDLLKAMWKGFTGGGALPGAGIILKILEGLRGVPGAISSWVDDLGVKLGVWALDAFEAMGRGARTKMGQLVEWLKGRGSAFLSALGNLGGLLYRAGVALLQGLYDGILNKWDDVKDLVGGMASWIASHKGPLEKDRILLKPAGVALMEGLIAGIEKGKVKLTTVLEKLTAYIKKHQGKLADLLDKKSAVVESLRGFTSSIFSADVTPDENGQPAGIQRLLDFGRQQRANAEQLAANVKSLISKGLSKDLIQQLVDSGASGQAQINLLAAGTAQDIQLANEDAQATAAALSEAGLAAGGALYNAAIKQEERDIRQAQIIKGALKEILDEQDKNTVVELHLDGHKILWSLKKIKRENGGHLGLGDRDPN